MSSSRSLSVSWKPPCRCGRVNYQRDYTIRKIILAWKADLYSSKSYSEAYLHDYEQMQVQEVHIKYSQNGSSYAFDVPKSEFQLFHGGVPTPRGSPRGKNENLPRLPPITKPAAQVQSQRIVKNVEKRTKRTPKGGVAWDIPAFNATQDSLELRRRITQRKDPICLQALKDMDAQRAEAIQAKKNTQITIIAARSALRTAKISLRTAEVLHRHVAILLKLQLQQKKARLARIQRNKAIAAANKKQREHRQAVLERKDCLQGLHVKYWSQTLAETACVPEMIGF